jgi:hypothetical protein
LGEGARKAGGSMSTTDSITDRIHKAADDELKRQIEVAFASVEKALGIGFSHRITIFKHGNKEVSLETSTIEAIASLKKKAFEFRRDKYRSERIDSFMKRVSEFQDRYEEINQYMEGEQ